MTGNSGPVLYSRTGLSLEFYAGDAEAIGHAVSRVAFDSIRDGTGALAYADLSPHLLAEDSSQRKPYR
jgi:hypothetical protein